MKKEDSSFYIDKVWFQNFKMYFNADNREETIVKAVFSVDYINNEPINLDIENFLSEFRQKY